MGQLSQITTSLAKRLLRWSEGQHGSSPPVGKGLPVANPLTYNARLYTVSYERGQVHRDMHRMDTDDPLVTTGFNTITWRSLGLEDNTLPAFTVTLEKEDPEPGTQALTDTQLERAQWEIRSLNKRLKLPTIEARQIIRRAIKYGNEFREIIVDESGRRIVRLKHLPEQTIWPVLDEKGNKRPGWVQEPETGGGIEEVISFAEYEILHFPFGEIDNYLGTPLLKSVRKDWKRLNMALDFTGSARINRAFARYLHRVPISSSWSPQERQAAINEYIAKMKERKWFDDDDSVLGWENNPDTVFTDFFIPDDGTNRGGVDLLDPENAQLQNIEDIKHMTQRMLSAFLIPMRYWPFESGNSKLSEGGGTAEDKNFACLLVACQDLLKDGLERLYDMQLVLAGIDPTKVRYVFTMANISTVDQYRLAQTQMALVTAMTELLENYPELREYLPVMLREYTRVSDASLTKLATVKVKPLVPEPPEETDGDEGGGGAKPTTTRKRKRDKRITLPDVGAGTERERV